MAYNTLLDGSFEEMLQQADAADALAQRLGNQGANGAGTAGGGAANGGAPGGVSDITLLRPPRVFNLAIVWDSPQVGVV